MSGDMLQFPRSLNAAFRRPHGCAPAIPESTTACACPGPVSLERGETGNAPDDLSERLYVSLLLTLSEKVIDLEVEMQDLRKQVKDLSHMVGP